MKYDSKRPIITPIVNSRPDIKGYVAERPADIMEQAKGRSMEVLQLRIELWLEVLQQLMERKEDVTFIKGKLQGAADALWIVGWDLTVDCEKYTYQLRKRD